ncbi:hypothetical protein GFV12_00940 [Desulfurobacterium thermolithotrophum]|uniref:hypothetical protein n=1 Tax=Desulfurobacterium thermolithotrophum TaxID=64160 RepID=UPI0013CF4BD7|nr:hypothetical protein [Desulfurobacterium thermolithotrophum]
MRLRWLFTFILFVIAVISSYFALESYAEVKLKEKLDRKLSSLPLDVTYRKFDYKLLENTVTIENLRASQLGYSIFANKIIVDLPISYRKKEIPENLHLKVEGLKIPLKTPFISNFSKTLNLKEKATNFIPLDLDVSYAFDGSILKIEFLTSSPLFGELKTVSYFTNITKQKLELLINGKADKEYTLKRIALAYFDLIYKDRGFIQNFLKKEAEQQGISVEEFKKKLIYTIESNSSSESVKKKIIFPLVSFIKNPSCLEVSLKPSEPISLKDATYLLNENSEVFSLIEKLGLTLKTCN